MGPPTNCRYLLACFSNLMVSSVASFDISGSTLMILKHSLPKTAIVKTKLWIYSGPINSNMLNCSEYSSDQILLKHRNNEIKILG